MKHHKAHISLHFLQYVLVRQRFVSGLENTKFTKKKEKKRLIYRKCPPPSPQVLSVYMSILVCMFKKAAFPHIYIRALTVHLFVSVTAPWWLLFTPSQGGEDEVMWEGRGKSGS